MQTTGNTPVPMKIPLHDYQVYAKDFVLMHSHCGLFLKMGTGKTSIVLEALWEINPNHHVLVIAPKVIARCTWPAEIQKWGMPFRTKSLIVNERGKQLSKKKREAICDEIPNDPPTVYFVNREMIIGLIEYLVDEKKIGWPFFTVIIDESQSFKSASSQGFRQLKRVRPWIYRMILLTGSPAPQGPIDLWSQIYLIDMGQRLERTLTKYRERYFIPTRYNGAIPIEYTPLPGAEDCIHNKISDVVISMTNKYITLPDCTYNDVFVEMDAPELKRYKDFMKSSVLPLTNGDQVEAVNAAVLTAKLSQMASGSIYTQTGSHEYELIHTNKLEMCEYIINNTVGCVLIAYYFHSDLDMLLRYLPEHRIPAVMFDGSPEMVTRWNQRQIPVMLIQPASAGFGLNFQDGGSTLIWYTLPWSLVDYEQTNARIYRQGQKEPVIIHHLMTKGTIDTRILSALKKKSTTQEHLLDAIEATISDAETD